MGDDDKNRIHRLTEPEVSQSAMWSLDFAAAKS